MRGRGARRRARRHAVAEPLVRELRQRQQHVVGLRARSADQQLVAEPGSQRDDVREALGADRNAVGSLRDPDIGIEAADRFH